MDNIIIFGIGTSGTRILVNAFNILGWHIGDVKQSVMEHLWTQNINKQILINNNICPCGATIADYPMCAKCGKDASQFESMPFNSVECIQSLNEPWVIKDPRFIITLSHDVWIDIWMQYRPLLLYVTRDYNSLVSKYKTKWKNTDDIYGYTLDELIDMAQEQYDLWQYNKIHISFEQIMKLYKLIDINRALRI